MGGSKKATVGYRYHLGVHAVLCQGPIDAIRGIYFDDRQAWVGSVSANTTLFIDAPDLFGGEDNQGGVRGNVDVLMGAEDQTQNTYLVQQLGANVPSYRGCVSLVFRGAESQQADISFGNKLGSKLAALFTRSFLWSAMNPYIKPVSIDASRITSGWTTSVFYPAKAAIGDDMNPAHIIYQILTDTVWGMGYPTASIDNTAFQIAADALHAEGFGLSFLLSQQDSFENLIQEVCRHVDGVVYLDKYTGKFVFKLVRGGYDLATLPNFDENNIVVFDSYQRATWGETTNDVVVVYSDAATEKDTSVNVQDLANIRIQGGVASRTIAYPGIRSAALAYRVAARDLSILSTPLAALQITVDRSAWNLNVTDRFKLSWEKLGLSEMVFRVSKIDYGSLTDGRIKIEAVEDVFVMPSNAYGVGQGSLWPSPYTQPDTVSIYRHTEASYYELVRYVDAASLATLNEFNAYLITMSARPSSKNTEVSVWRSYTTTLDDFKQFANGTATPSVALAVDLTSKTQTVIQYNSPIDFEWDGELNSYAFINDETIEVLSVDNALGTMTVKRGCLDTIPQTHAAGSRIWFFDGELGVYDFSSPLSKDVPEYLRIRGKNYIGLSPLNTAPQHLFTGVGRWFKPWPPANVRINDELFPTAPVVGKASIKWVSRNRLQQTGDTRTGWTEAGIVPEPRTTYTLRVTNEATDAILVHKNGLEVDLADGVYVFRVPVNTTPVPDNIRIELWAVRDGIDSHQKFEHVVPYQVDPNPPGPGVIEPDGDDQDYFDQYRAYVVGGSEWIGIGKNGLIWKTVEDGSSRTLVTNKTSHPFAYDIIYDAIRLDELYKIGGRYFTFGTGGSFGSGLVLCYSDDLKTWTKVVMGYGSGFAINISTPPGGAGRGGIAYYNGAIYFWSCAFIHYTNDGVTWTNTAGAIDTVNSINTLRTNRPFEKLELFYDGSTYFGQFVLDNGYAPKDEDLVRVLRSVDNTANWTEHTSNVPLLICFKAGANFYGSYVTRSNDRVVSAYQGAYKSTDGFTWSANALSETALRTGEYVHSIRKAGANIVAWIESGVFLPRSLAISTNNGSTWNRYEPGQFQMISPERKPSTSGCLESNGLPIPNGGKLFRVSFSSRKWAYAAGSNFGSTGAAALTLDIPQGFIRPELIPPGSNTRHLRKYKGYGVNAAIALPDGTPGSERGFMLASGRFGISAFSGKYQIEFKFTVALAERGEVDNRVVIGTNDFSLSDSGRIMRWVEETIDYTRSPVVTGLQPGQTFGGSGGNYSGNVMGLRIPAHWEVIAMVPPFDAGDIISVASDITNRREYYYKNGTLIHTRDISAPAYPPPVRCNGSDVEVNIGHTSFVHGQSGYTGWANV